MPVQLGGMSESSRRGVDQEHAREQILERRLEQIEHKLREIVRSRSWRLTAPLRALMRRGKRSAAMRRLPDMPTLPIFSRYRLVQCKAAIRSQAQAALDAFLASGDRIVLPQSASPQVSIVLVLFNQAALTLECLQALASNARLTVELLVVDNGSTDRTGDLLERLDGARIIRNAENRHYLRGVNQAAQATRGQALLLLNNDAFIRTGALEAAWSTLFSRPDIGAVGGPLVLPDGTLQEAGSIIWSDGSCAGYGRGFDPGAPEFQFAREVDFCSGAFILVRRSVFEALGGLDEAFAPAYYEEVDFCMRLRDAGWRIFFEPRAVADHFEFASSPSTQQALLLQQQHHMLFLERHQAVLRAHHFAPNSSELRARTRGQFRGRLLMIEDRVPFPSLGTGYPRSARILHELIAAGWFVTLYPLIFMNDNWADIRAHFPAETEVMVGRGEMGLSRFLKERAGFYDTILVTRPHNMRSFLSASTRDAASFRLLYDAEAIFADRQLASLQITGVRPTDARRRDLLESEIKLARAAETVIAVTERDATIFRDHGCADVRVLGHCLSVVPTEAALSGRADLLFVGALDDNRSPNVDALVWFVSRIMPRLDALLGGDYRLIIAGRCQAERVFNLAGPRVRLFGRLEDLTPLYASARVFIAPTRFAAGIPLKVQEAASRGLPVVATSLLATQLGWENERELLVADTAETFAAACARLYRDSTLWHQLRDAALARIAGDCDEQAFAQTLRSIVQFEANRSPRALPISRSHLAGPVRWSRASRSRVLLRAAWRRWRENGWRDLAQRVIVELRKQIRRDYTTWVRLYDTIRPPDESAIASHLVALSDHPTFSLTIIVGQHEQPEALQATLDSVSGQIYPDWEVWIAHQASSPALREVLDRCAARDPRVRMLRCDPSASHEVMANTAVANASGEFIATITSGDRLGPHALYIVAIAGCADPDVEVFYADEDTGPGEGVGRSDPVFKPDWSPELLLQPDAIGRFVAMRRSAMVAAGGYRDGLGTLMAFELLLRIVDTGKNPRIGHLPHILCHRAESSAAAPPGEALSRVLAEHLQRVGESADVEIHEGIVRVSFHLRETPLVSVIIPTKDQPTLLKRCIAGLLERTDYPRLEIMIVDNETRDPVGRRLLAELVLDPRVRVIPFRDQFNYAAMNNRAVADAQGDVVALLNDDIAVRESGWLREMVSQALRRGVGAVGAKLYYPDRTIQHAGVVLGMLGIAGHPFRHTDGGAAGPLGRLKRLQTVSCVTGACMVLRRAVYDEIGGMDEVNLPVSYNDVDLCLRLRERGYRIVWTPWAELEHFESATRGADSERRNAKRAQAEAEYMQRRWGPVLHSDPFYSPNLTIAAEDGGLAFPPRVTVPWADYLPHERR